MYQTGQYVRYGGNGIFCVQDIITKQHAQEKAKPYYVMEGVFGNEMRITTPTDHPGLRGLISKAEAKDVLKRVSHIAADWPPDRRVRSEAFKAMLASTDWNQTLKVMKTIYCQKVMKERNHKQLAVEEMDILDHTRRILTEELALALAVPLTVAEDQMVQIEQLCASSCADTDQ